MRFRDDQRLTVRTDVLSRQLDGEAVLLDLQAGTYFGLNEVGALVWDLLCGGASIGDVRDRICRDYAVDPTTAATDVEGIIDELLRRELLQLADQAP